MSEAVVKVLRTSHDEVRSRALRHALVVYIAVGLVFWIPVSGCASQVARIPPLDNHSQKDYGFTSGTSALRIPIEEDDGHIFLQVRINDSKPVWFGLDTGATHSLIHKRYAESLGLKSGSTQPISGAGGTEQASIFKGVSLKLPGANLYNQTLWGLPLDPIAAANGHEMAGILGYDLFKYFVVDIDYAAKLMNLYEPRGYQYRGAGQMIPLNIQHDGAIYVQAKVQTPGGNTLEDEFVIDTGGNQTLLLARTFVEKHRLLDLVGKTLPVGGGGVGGAIQLAMGRMKSLELGRFAIPNPLAGLTKVGEIADAGKAGNIGGGFLRRFRVIFDYSRSRMILEPNARLAEPDEFDMSGAAVMSEPPDFKLIKVFRVRPDSLAAQAGLKPQDVIIAVDGQPATTLNVSKLRKMFRVERECQLKVKRGEQIVEVKLKLRRLI